MVTEDVAPWLSSDRKIDIDGAREMVLDMRRTDPAPRISDRMEKELLAVIANAERALTGARSKEE